MTTQEILGGYLLAVVVSIPLALAVALLALHGEGGLSGDRLPADHPEDRHRAAVHHLVRLRLHARSCCSSSCCRFFPIVVSSIAGFKSVDPDVMDFARTTGAGGWQLFFKIRLPQALPDIFTGLKVGAALSATAAVVAEFVASDRGLGYLLLQYNGQLDTPMVFAIIVLLSLIGLAVYYVGRADRAPRDSLARLAAGRPDVTATRRRIEHNAQREERHDTHDGSSRRCRPRRRAAAVAAPAHGAGHGVAAAQLVSRRPARAVLLRQGARASTKQEGIDLTINEGRGSANTVQVVAAGSDTFGLADSSQRDHHRRQGRRHQVGDVAAQLHRLLGRVARLGRHRTPKDLEGKSLAVSPGDPLGAAAPGGAPRTTSVDCAKINFVQVDPAAKVVTVLEKSADALLGGADDQFFLIKYKRRRSRTRCATPTTAPTSSA